LNPADAVLGVGAQVLLGAGLGLVWLAVSPRPSARWAGTFWYAESDAGFAAAQSAWFALLTAVPGLAAGAWLVWRSGRPAPVLRAACWLGGAALGSAACWLVGAGLGGGLGSGLGGGADAAFGAELAAAPLALTAPGLLALWPFGAAAVATLGLAARAAFGRTW
jgi:hypothetical protein